MAGQKRVALVIGNGNYTIAPLKNPADDASAIDAGRDNPFGGSFRSMSRGLTRMQLPTGSMILYVASPGQKAADGNGRNGVFTRNLLQQMQRPGLSVDQVFKQTVESVYNKTGSQTKKTRTKAKKGISSTSSQRKGETITKNHYGK